MKTIFCIVIIIFSTFSAIQAQTTKNETIKIKQGSSVTIDGKIEENEWKDASVFEMSDGGKVYLKQNGAELYVGIRGTKMGLSQLYIREGESSDVSILHASSALSSVIYKQDSNKLWQPTDAVPNDLRDKTITSETQKKMADYFTKYNWVANNVHMGNPTDIEYKVKRQNVADKQMQIAVGFMFWDDSGVRNFPTTLADDCIKERVMGGFKPPDVKFNFSQWVTVKLK